MVRTWYEYVYDLRDHNHKKNRVEHANTKCLEYVCKLTPFPFLKSFPSRVLTYVRTYLPIVFDPPELEKVRK